jgi:phosphohistidine phosphatase SixA
MHLKAIFTVILLLVATVQTGCSSLAAIGVSTVEHKPLVVFLVRHGEKADLSQNSVLSAEGQKRAVLLAESLRSANIEFVHSTNFMRTIQTADPTANKFGLDVKIYDPNNLNTFANDLRQLGGRHLIVGHSNTTPSMVEHLGGDPGNLVFDENEFDRLYIVTTGSDGDINTVLMRYGKPYKSE